MHTMTKGKVLNKNKAKYVFGIDVYSGLVEIKDDIQLGKS